MAWGKSPAGVASWVEKLKANDPSLTSVTVFRGRLFGAAEASEVCAALRTNTHLAELYASGHPMDASTAACFADMLATNATLRSLCVGDDAFGDAGLAALAPGVARSASLAALDLENKGVGDAGGEALGAALATASLSELILSRNPALGSRGVAAVCAGAAAGGRLAALRLAELALDGDAPAALAALLASPCPLTILYMDRVRAFVYSYGPSKLRYGLSRRRARGAAPLDAFLDGRPETPRRRAAGGDVSAESSSPSALPVRSLSLRGCGVGAAGARALAAAIASTETLRLGENTVGDDGAVSLAEALANASSLATLDVSSNGVGAVGAAALVREATTLRELSLFGNEAIGDAGLAAATEAAGAGAPCRRVPRRGRMRRHGNRARGAVRDAHRARGRLPEARDAGGGWQSGDAERRVGTRVGSVAGREAGVGRRVARGGRGGLQGRARGWRTVVGAAPGATGGTTPAEAVRLREMLSRSSNVRRGVARSVR